MRQLPPRLSVVVKALRHQYLDQRFVPERWAVLMHRCQLTEREALVLHAHLIGGRKMADLAGELECSVQNVSAIWLKALNKILDQMNLAHRALYTQPRRML